MGNTPQNQSDVCGVMTTFEPGPSIIDRVRDISCQVGHLVLVNDSGSQSVARELDEQLSDLPRVCIIHNADNSGIAYSLNAGIRRAVNIGYNWFITLDDDSEVHSDLVAKVVKIYRELACKYPIGVLALSREGDQVGDHTGVEKKRGVITSGSFFNKKVFDEVGGFRENLFIDLVDYEFCCNIRKLDYVVLKSSEVGMLHPVGRISKHKIFGMEVTTFNHPPFRKYYISRNSIVLANEVLFHDPLLSAVLIVDVVYTSVKVLFFEDQKKVKMQSIVRGVMDGFAGRLGKYTARS